MGAQTVDGPEEANGGAVVGTLLCSGSLHSGVTVLGARLRQLMGQKKQKCLFTDSLHRLGSRFARTSSVPLEITFVVGVAGLVQASMNAVLPELSLMFNPMSFEPE